MSATPCARNIVTLSTSLSLKQASKQASSADIRKLFHDLSKSLTKKEKKDGEWKKKKTTVKELSCVGLGVRESFL